MLQGSLPLILKTQKIHYNKTPFEIYQLMLKQVYDYVLVEKKKNKIFPIFIHQLFETRTIYAMEQGLQVLCSTNDKYAS